jgi:regulator of protease activity HflC (stomatin/prohibitin superfamily)
MINIVIILAVLLNVTNAFFTTIKTGDVGVAFVWNEIQKDLYYPGLTIYNSLTTRVEIVDILPQTDEVLNVECGTKDGIKAKFDKVQIGNQLKSEYVIKTISHFGLNYDKYLVTDLVRHQINVICSKKTAHEIAIDYFDQLDDELFEFIKNENERQETGLIIHFVRLSKPILPESIQKNYLALAEERTMKKVIEEKKERTRAEKETEILISQKYFIVNFGFNLESSKEKMCCCLFFEMK